jgi:uncharacterized membrane protein YoaK (UPF0700 family)
MDASNNRGLGTSGQPVAVRSTPGREILLLAIAGGGVDAILLLGFGVLTAAQTGNTILLAVALSQRHLVVALDSAVSIGSYVAGAALGELVLDTRTGKSSRLPPVGWALFVELLALVALLTTWLAQRSRLDEQTSLVLVALAAIAMGVQSAAVLRIHAGPSTTYVTGTITTFTTDVIRWPHLVTHHQPATGTVPKTRPWIYGVTWLVYLAGATTTGLLYLAFGASALLLPIVAVIAVVLITARTRVSAAATPNPGTPPPALPQ